MNTYQQPQAYYAPPQRPPRKRHTAWIVIGAAFLGLALLGGLAAFLGSAATPVSQGHRHGQVYRLRHETVSAQPVAPAGPRYSVAQRQAIAAAEGYLQTEPGFSRYGLIQQLSSKYGSGFSRRLAVFAVKHVHANWMQQAVYSAKSYMQTQPGWSYGALVQQLHSRYGAGFTLRQAEYGAHAVGL